MNCSKNKPFRATEIYQPGVNHCSVCGQGMPLFFNNSSDRDLNDLMQIERRLDQVLESSPRLNEQMIALGIATIGAASDWSQHDRPEASPPFGPELYERIVVMEERNVQESMGPMFAMAVQEIEERSSAPNATLTVGYWALLTPTLFSNPLGWSISARRPSAEMLLEKYEETRALFLEHGLSVDFIDWMWLPFFTVGLNAARAPAPSPPPTRHRSASLQSAFPGSPWASVLDWLCQAGIADETVHGDISNQKGFTLETLVGPSGRIGLSFVHVLGQQPTPDDIYAYWLRLAQAQGGIELRIVSRETGFYGAWPFSVSRPGAALSPAFALIKEHNERHTRARQTGSVHASTPTAYHDMMGSTPEHLLPTPELRKFLAFFYNTLHKTDLANLREEDLSRFQREQRVSRPPRQARAAPRHQPPARRPVPTQHAPAHRPGAEVQAEGCGCLFLLWLSIASLLPAVGYAWPWP